MTLATNIALRKHRPTIMCWIDGRRVYGVTGRIVFSMRAKVALCSLTLKTRPDWLQFHQRVEVSLGYDGLVRRRFTGFVEDDGRKVWPYSKTISAAGYMRWAERKTSTVLTYSSQTAQAIVTALLTAAGVPFVSIGGDNTTLATLENILLAKRQAYLDLIEQIDTPWLCRTFDWLPDGTVRRMQVTELPAASPKWSYAYPGNVLSLDNPTTVKEVKNRVEVSGLNGVTAYRRADSPYVDPAHDEILGIQSDLIETAGVASDVALLQMPSVNRITRTVTIRVAGNPLLDPGDTIALDAPKVGINSENLWLEGIDDAFDDSGYFSQLTLTGGAGEAGYQFYLPIASFVMTITREAFDAGLGVAVWYTILCDGSASSSPEGKAITFAWSNSVTADTGTATTYSFRLTVAQFTGGCNVTLIVTDSAAENDTLVRSVTDSANHDGTIVRTLYTARDTEAEASGNSGESWTTDLAVDAQCTPEIAGENHSYYGMADGKLYYTGDLLATKTLVHTFASAVNWIWINEINADRVMVGCADGKVLTTINASLLAGATWTEEADYASPVKWVCWSWDDVRWVCVASQIIANGVVQWELDAGYTAKHLALSFVANYASGDNGAGTVQVKRGDGVALTFAGGVPTTDGGLQHHISDDILYFVDGATGDLYRKAAGSTVLTKLSTIGGGVTYHLLRDGRNALVLWASTAAGLYKSYTGGATWFLMRAGKTLAAGYASAPWTSLPVGDLLGLFVPNTGGSDVCRLAHGVWSLLNHSATAFEKIRKLGNSYWRWTGPGVTAQRSDDACANFTDKKANMVDLREDAGGRLWALVRPAGSNQITTFEYSDNDGDNWTVSYTVPPSAGTYVEMNKIACHPTDQNIIAVFGHDIIGVTQAVTIYTINRGSSWIADGNSISCREEGICILSSGRVVAISNDYWVGNQDIHWTDDVSVPFDSWNKITLQSGVASNIAQPHLLAVGSAVFASYRNSFTSGKNWHSTDAAATFAEFDTEPANEDYQGAIYYDLASERFYVGRNEMGGSEGSTNVVLSKLRPITASNAWEDFTYNLLAVESAATTRVGIDGLIGF